jgi:hypothetical protein
VCAGRLNLIVLLHSSHVPVGIRHHDIDEVNILKFHEYIHVNQSLMFFKHYVIIITCSQTTEPSLTFTSPDETRLDAASRSSDLPNFSSMID